MDLDTELGASSLVINLQKSNFNPLLTYRVWLKVNALLNHDMFMKLHTDCARTDNYFPLTPVLRIEFSGNQKNNEYILSENAAVIDEIVSITPLWNSQ